MKSKSETVILVDMDDVIVDLLPHWVNALNRKFNLDVKSENITDWDMTKFFPSVTTDEVYKPLTEKSFWKEIKPIDQARYYLKLMTDEGYQIYVCTSTHWKNVKFKVKYILNKYFDFIPWENVIVTARKQFVKADYLIDDCERNLLGGDYTKLLFTQPHNMFFSTKYTDIVRVNNWKEIYNYISLRSE